MPICMEKIENARRFVPNFHVVSERVVRGGQTDGEGLQHLKDAGVRLVINLCGGPNLISLFNPSAAAGENPEVAQERQLAQSLGLEFISIPLDVFRAPSATCLTSFVDVISQPEKGPIFVHCLHGRDRTGLMTGLYRVACDGWTAEKAYAEMVECGFDRERTNLSDALFQFAKSRS